MTTPRPMSTQSLYLQKETTPGTPLTNAMRRYMGIKASPGWNVETQSFTPSGSKIPIAPQIVSEEGRHSVEAIQCFNSLLPVLASVLSYGGVSQPDAGDAPNAYEHVFALNASAPDSLNSFTAIWGDGTQALQMAYFLFNSLGFTIQRGQLGVTTNALSYEPTTGASIPGAGVTDIPAVPFPARGYDVFIDDTWAGAGTTQTAATYEFGLTLGDKRASTAPIDSRVQAFKALIENDNAELTGNIRPAFGTEAIVLRNAYKAGAAKFIQVVNTGPVIGGDVRYLFELTISTVITKPGEVGAAPNAPIVTLPFDYQLVKDTVSGNTMTVRLINTVPTL